MMCSIIPTIIMVVLWEQSTYDKGKRADVSRTKSVGQSELKKKKRITVYLVNNIL